MQKYFEQKIDVLLEQLNNRKFGLDNKARNQIVQYFHIVTLEKRYQILRRLLDGNSLDRYAGYNCIESKWDDSYIEFVENMWNQYHDIRCARFICRYFPIEYIKEHLSALASILNLEVDHEKKCFFISEKSSSSENISIAIIANLKDKQNSKELWEMLYEIIRDYTDNFQDDENPLVVKEFLRVYRVAKGKHYFTSRYIPGVSQILECMYHMGFQDTLMEFHKFDFDNQMILSNQLLGIPVNLHPTKENWIECWKWFLEIVQEKSRYYNINEDKLYEDEEIQELINKSSNSISEKQMEKENETLKKMQENNPFLKDLQETFDLII